MPWPTTWDELWNMQIIRQLRHFFYTKLHQVCCISALWTQILLFLVWDHQGWRLVLQQKVSQYDKQGKLTTVSHLCSLPLFLLHSSSIFYTLCPSVAAVRLLHLSKPSWLPSPPFIPKVSKRICQSLTSSFLTLSIAVTASIFNSAISSSAYWLVDTGSPSSEHASGPAGLTALWEAVRSTLTVHHLSQISRDSLFTLMVMSYSPQCPFPWMAELLTLRLSPFVP